MSRIRFTTTLIPASTRMSSLKRAKFFLDTNRSIGITRFVGIEPAWHPLPERDVWHPSAKAMKEASIVIGSKLLVRRLARMS
jgi:hypothetical protein